MTVAQIAKQSVTAFGEDKVTRLASSIAFAAIFSIAPLFIVLIAILGTIVGGHGAAQASLLAAVRSGAGSAAAETIRQIVASSFDKPRQGIIAQIIGWAVFIVGASNLFAALQDALNSIWGVEKTKGGFRQIVRDRLASTGMIVVIGFVAIVTFAANAGVAIITTHVSTYVPGIGNPLVLAAVAQLLTFVVVSVVFALIFKILPDVELDWRDAIFGGFVTAILFTVGQIVIGLYFTRGGVTSAYGAAGSLLVALLWIYYSVVIMLFGAEVTKTIAAKAKLTAAAEVRKKEDRPAGSDPRDPTPGSATA
jgi:membrane protein